MTPSFTEGDFDEVSESSSHDLVKDRSNVTSRSPSVTSGHSLPVDGPYDLGDDRQAQVPGWDPIASSGLTDSRDDVLLWSPSHEDGLDAFLAAALEGGFLTAEARCSPCMERSLEMWCSHGAHGIGAALAALKEALAVDRSARLSTEEVARLGQELQRCGNNFRAVAAAMAPHLEATSAASASAAASSSAAASASAATSSLARTLPQLVESYYLDHYLQLGFAQDEMRFASVATLRERLGARRRAKDLGGDAHQWDRAAGHQRTFHCGSRRTRRLC